MAKALITTQFPSTAEVARKLGLAESRIKRVTALMDRGLDATAGKFAAPPRKQAAQRKGSTASKPKRKRDEKG